MYRYFFIFLFLVSCSSRGWVKPSLERPEISKGQQSTDKKQPKVVKNDQQIDDLIGTKVKLRPTKKKKKTYLFDERKIAENTRENKKKNTATTSTAKSKKTQKPKTVKERKKYAVSYSGNQFIRQKKTHPRTGQEGIVLAIRGNAAIRHRHTTIYSPLLEVLGEDGAIAIAPTRIKIHDRKENTILSAGYGEYIKYERRALVRNSPVVVNTDKKDGSKTTIRADEMERFIAEARTVCYGNVIIEGDNYIAYGDKATYFESSDIIALQGDAKIFQEDNIYLADVMKFYNGKNRANMTGNVKLILTNREKGKKSAQELNKESEQKTAVKKSKTEKTEEGTVTTIVYAEESLYEYGKTIRYGRKATFFSKGDKAVKVERSDSTTYCNLLKVWGPGPTEILATDNVQILYKKDNSQVYSEYVHHERLKNLIRMKTISKNKKKIKPKVIFYDEKGVPAGRLVAETIERNLLQEKTQARGAVVINMFKDVQGQPLPEFGKINPDMAFNFDSESSIHGQWAEIFQEDRVAYVYGNPYVQRNKSQLFGREIVLYPDSRRFEILGSIRGKLRQ